jgi:hypothetical protein
MSTRQNTDYGYDIQKVYLEMMMTDAESFVRCQAVFDPGAFDRRLEAPAKFLNDYVTEHNALPNFDMINAVTYSIRVSYKKVIMIGCFLSLKHLVGTKH